MSSGQEERAPNRRVQPRTHDEQGPMNSKDPPKCGCLVQGAGLTDDTGVRVQEQERGVMADESGDAPHVL